ncbi:MAG: hypothetical protein IKP65_05465 [Alphaproteobacteria bacterium]|nr:hypothetical protein [Alphaproteobacteria bacterium]
MDKKFNIAIAFLNHSDLLEKDNFFIADDIKIIEESTGRCFNFILDVKPVNYSSNMYIPHEGFTIAFAYNEENKMIFNCYYKCYFIVSSTSTGKELKNKLINELINQNNEAIRISCIKISDSQSNLKCLFELKE